MKSKLLIFFLPLLLSSCGTWYYSTLNSRGTIPLDKTYCISTSDSLLINTLEFKEYAEVLKLRLNEIGYIEEMPSLAALTIFLDYKLGDMYLESTNTDSSTFSTTSVNTNIKSSTNTDTSVKVSANGNLVKAQGSENSSSNTTVKSTGYSTSYTGSTSTNSYKIPLLVTIYAVNNDNNEPIWEVTIHDDLTRETQMQSVMPWLILSAQPYFGKSSQGEITTRINNTQEIKERYNLIWPY